MTSADLRQFDEVTARFMPVRRDDLRPGAERFIGAVMRFQAAWIIEEGDYEGLWAMQILEDSRTPFFWVPDVDLEIAGRG